MTKVENLVDLVASRIDRSPHVKAWWMRLTDEQRQQIEPLRTAWREGRFGRRKITAARAISATLQEIGIPIGPQGVQNWLRETT